MTTEDASTNRTFHELPIDFAFMDDEHQQLQQFLLNLKRSPYTEYYEFSEEVRSALKSGDVPWRLCGFAQKQIDVDRTRTLHSCR